MSYNTDLIVCLLFLPFPTTDFHRFSRGCCVFFPSISFPSPYYYVFHPLLSTVTSMLPCRCSFSPALPSSLSPCVSSVTSCSFSRALSLSLSPRVSPSHSSPTVMLSAMHDGISLCRNFSPRLSPLSHYPCPLRKFMVRSCRADAPGAVVFVEYLAFITFSSVGR